MRNRIAPRRGPSVMSGKRPRIGIGAGVGVGMVAAVLAVVGPAARGETLRWKFQPGETLHYSMDQKTVTTARFPGGQENKTTLAQTIEMTWAVKGVDANGYAELTQTIGRIRDQVEGQVGSYVYDSKDGKEPDSLIAASRLPLFKAMLGAPISFKMSPEGEPGDIRLPETLTKALTALGPAAAGAEALFSEEGLKEMISQAGLIFPKDDLAAGKSWTRQTKNVVPPLGTLVREATYRYDGPAADAGPEAVKIGLATRIEIVPEENAAPIALANPNANGIKIKSQKSQGSYTFDRGAGHLLDSTLTDLIEVSASIKVGLGTASREMEVSQSTETTTVRKLVKDVKE
jgi:hypothetical protein